MSNNTVILGGGLAGLAASIFSGMPIYEAQDKIGGIAASDTVDGFTFDRGIHVLHTRDEIVLKLLTDLGVDMLDHSRHAYIYSHKIYTAYPFQINTAGLPIGLRMKCVWDFLNRQKEPEPTNYQEWMYRALGRSFADTFLIPYSEKFWSVHPSEMTFEWTGGKVPEPSLWQVFRGAILSKQTNVGANVDFRYPIISAGYGAIATAMKKKTAEINYKHKATTINTDKKSIVFENNKEITYSTLLSSIPLPELVRICPTAPDNVKEAVSKLRTNSIMVVNLGINRPKISDKHWVHFPEQDVSFFRISYPHNFADNVTPAGMSSITAEVSYSRDDPPNEEELIKQVIKDLIRVKALDADAPVVLKTTKDIPYAYCVYDKQREASLEVIHNWMQSVDILPIGRYGEWTYYWSDEAILSGKHAADKLQELSKTT